MSRLAGRFPFSWALALFAAALCLMTACGRKGLPLPPLPVVPAPVANLRAEPRESSIVLSWARPDRNTDGSPLTDLREFRISRATLARGAAGVPASAFSFLATVRADAPDNAAVEGTRYAYRDDAGGQGLLAERQYRYRVQAINRRGESGPFPADAIVDFTALPAPPQGLKAAAGDGIVDLTWDAPSTSSPGGEPPPKGYNVYRATTPGEYGGQPINASPVLERKFRDAGVENDVRYFYAVRSVANDRPPWRESANSGEASVTPQDYIPPAPPRGLVAIPGERDVALSWSANAEPDLLGYVVYRRRLPEVAFVRLTATPVPGTTYTDRAVQAGASYVYAVTAVDRSRRQNESAPSVEVEVRIP